MEFCKFICYNLYSSINQNIISYIGEDYEDNSTVKVLIIERLKETIYFGRKII